MARIADRGEVEHLGVAAKRGVLQVMGGAQLLVLKLQLDAVDLEFPR
jgi:hypothetical protein